MLLIFSEVAGIVSTLSALLHLAGILLIIYGVVMAIISRTLPPFIQWGIVGIVLLLLGRMI